LANPEINVPVDGTALSAKVLSQLKVGQDSHLAHHKQK
jgi:hypothetical protein